MRGRANVFGVKCDWLGSIVPAAVAGAVVVALSAG